MAISEFEEHELETSPADELTSRVVVITGGTRGIGAAISRCLAASGATVAAAYGSNRERAEQFRAELTRAGRPVSIHHGDVGSVEDCRRVVDEVIDEHGDFRV